MHTAVCKCAVNKEQEVLICRWKSCLQTDQKKSDWKNKFWSWVKDMVSFGLKKESCSPHWKTWLIWVINVGPLNIMNLKKIKKYNIPAKLTFPTNVNTAFKNKGEVIIIRCSLHIPGAAIVMRDRTTCDMPLTAAYWHNNKAVCSCWQSYTNC